MSGLVLEDLVDDGCVACGCTDAQACEGGCEWVTEGLCSRCAPLCAHCGASGRFVPEGAICCSTLEGSV